MVSPGGAPATDLATMTAIHRQSNALVPRFATLGRRPACMLSMFRVCEDVNPHLHSFHPPRHHPRPPPSPPPSPSHYPYLPPPAEHGATRSLLAYTGRKIVVRALGTRNNSCSRQLIGRSSESSSSFRSTVHRSRPSQPQILPRPYAPPPLILGRELGSLQHTHSFFRAAMSWLSVALPPSTAVHRQGR